MKRTVRIGIALLLLFAMGCTVQQRTDGGFRIDTPPLFGTSSPGQPRSVVATDTIKRSNKRAGQTIPSVTPPGGTIPSVTPPTSLPGTTIPPVSPTAPVTATLTPTTTVVPTGTGTPTGTVTPPGTVSPTSTGTPVGTGTPGTGTPTGSPSPTGTQSATPGTPTSGPSPTSTAGGTATATGTPTPAVTPTNTPAPAAIFVGGEQSFTEGSTLFVVGEVVNGTSQEVYNVKVIGTFFDGNRIVAARETLAYLPMTVPTQHNPFKLEIPNAPSSVDRYELSLVWDDISIARFDRLTMLREELVEEEEGTKIVGEIGNNSGQPMRDIRVVVTLYDTDGTVINTFPGTPTENTLAPGASTAYEIAMPAGIEFERYLVQTQGMLAVQ